MNFQVRRGTMGPPSEPALRHARHRCQGRRAACGGRRRRHDGGPMKLSGPLIVPAPRAEVFDALRHARLVPSCVEGVRDLQEIDATHYRAVMETKVAYIKFKFDVAVEVTRVDPPHAIEAKIEGTPHGIVGRLSAASVTTLADESEGTRVAYEI